MEVIIPCAGASSRFPNMRPKYLLTDYAGRLMVQNAAEHYIDENHVTIVIIKEHDEKYKSKKKLEELFGNKVNVVVLDEPTSGPADTVYQAIKLSKINLQSQLLIKDCDSFYKTQKKEGNVIYIAKLSNHPQIRTAGFKSYTLTNNEGAITSVIEKKIVSDHFCVGGYQFKTTQNFINAFDGFSFNFSPQNELFVSNIVNYSISQGDLFFENEVEEFIDVGTANDWFHYNNKPTYFCDIDGTIVKSKFDYHEPYEAIWENISPLLEEKARGCKIIFTTSRPERFRKKTLDMLSELGFGDCELIMGLHHSKRIVINDYAASNPYPTAVSINIKRDSHNLADMISQQNLWLN
jgi:hypothetical protein